MGAHHRWTVRETSYWLSDAIHFVIPILSCSQLLSVIWIFLCLITDFAVTGDLRMMIQFITMVTLSHVDSVSVSQLPIWDAIVHYILCYATLHCLLPGRAVSFSYSDQTQGFAEISLLSLWFTVSQGESLGDFLLAPACPIEKVNLWVSLLYSTSTSETNEIVKRQGFRLNWKLIWKPLVPTPVHYPLMPTSNRWTWRCTFEQVVLRAYWTLKAVSSFEAHALAMF